MYSEYVCVCVSEYNIYLTTCLSCQHLNHVHVWVYSSEGELGAFIWLVCVSQSVMGGGGGGLLVQLFLVSSPESRYSRGMLSLSSSCPLFLSLSYSLSFSLLPSFTSYPSHWCLDPYLSLTLTSRHLTSLSFSLYPIFYLFAVCSAFTPHWPYFALLSFPRLFCYWFLFPPHSDRHKNKCQIREAL